jgi:hypothetical protein
MPVKSWDTTAANNDDADTASGVNWAEGQNPSTVNNSARAMMAEFAKWLSDNRGSLTTAGTGDAYTVTEAQTLGTLADGDTLMVRTDRANTGAATLDAKNWKRPDGTAYASGEITTDTIYLVSYHLSADEWRTVGESSVLVDSGTLVAETTYTSGSGNHVLNTSTRSYIIEAIGGGGGGGGTTATDADSAIGAGGGGGGAWGRSRQTGLSGGETIAYAVGAGGAGGAAATVGSNGGSTTFDTAGAILDLGGGLGGEGLSTGDFKGDQGGAGGTATTGTLMANGTGGGGGSGNETVASTNYAVGGTGGPGFRGAGGGVGAENDANGSAAGGYGAGGGGAASTNSDSSTGGAGSGGLIIIQEFT